MKYVEDFNPKLLEELRREKGLTQTRLNTLAELRAKAICDWEKCRSRPTPRLWEKVYSILTLSSAEIAKLEKTAPRIMATGLVYTFEEGHCYTIRRSKVGGNGSGRYRSQHVDEIAVFCYRYKEGIHHMFREIHGGWTRTYTDAQLIGKTIKEVEA